MNRKVKVQSVDMIFKSKLFHPVPQITMLKASIPDPCGEKKHRCNDTHTANFGMGEGETLCKFGI